jgi:hypothetical protein
MSYFSGQGKLKLAPLTNGVPASGHRWVGNVPDFKPAFAATKLDHKESYTGQRLPDKSLTTELKSTFTATLEDWSPENVALATRGTAQKTTSGAVTNELSPATLAVGETWYLKNGNVSALVITDSTGTPVTVDTADYTLDAAYGAITIVDLTGYTLPLKAAYTKGVVDVVPFFTEAVKEVSLMFEGINTADDNKKVRVELYRVALDPTKEMGLITEQFSQFVLEGTALIDSTKGEDPLFGKFGRMVYL